MPRLIIAAVAAATLIFAPSARADVFSVSMPTSPTNNPVIAFTHEDGDQILCGVIEGKHQTVTNLQPCASPWHPVVGVDDVYTFDVSSTKYGYGFVQSVTVDRNGPSITITTGPDDNSTQISPSVVYGFTSTDERNVASTACTWDTLPATCPDGTTPRTLTTGTHVLAITASDSLGNVTTVTRHVTIAAPQVIVDPGPTPTPTPTATPDPDVVPSQGGVLSAGATHATASLSIKKRTRGWTQLKSLTLRNVPAGTSIKVSCKGKGCPSKATTQKATKAGSITIKGLAGRKLHPGAAITLTLTQPSAKPQTIRILVRSTRSPQVT
jgi:hypothetical protein